MLPAKTVAKAAAEAVVVREMETVTDVLDRVRVAAAAAAAAAISIVVVAVVVVVVVWPWAVVVVEGVG